MIKMMMIKMMMIKPTTTMTMMMIKMMLEMMMIKPTTMTMMMMMIKMMLEMMMTAAAIAIQATLAVTHLLVTATLISKYLTKITDNV